MERSLPQEHFVRATTLLNIDMALNQYGLDPELELAAFGFLPAEFHNTELRLPPSQVADILQHCIKSSGCDHFILELVQRQTAAINSYWGMLLRTAPSLRDAIHLAVREMHIYSRGVSWAFLCEDNPACLRLSVDTMNLSSRQRQVLAELALAQGWFFLNKQCQQSVQLDTVHFVRDAPADMRPYRRFFGSPVKFNCDTDQLVFSATHLESRMSHSDPYLHSAIRKLIALDVTNIGKLALNEEVRSTIRMLLPLGSCTIEQVARHLMYDKRTLQRHLRDKHGVSYNMLLQEQRLKMAQTYLRESQKSITQIAYAVGYSEPSNMARAFRNKFNCTPQQWRELKSRKPIIRE